MRVNKLLLRINLKHCSSTTNYNAHPRLVWQLRHDADAGVPLREDASVDAARVVAILDLKLLAGRHGRLHAQW